MNDQWRERLRQAVKNRAAIAYTKESAIARDAGVAPETLSRVLKERHGRPSFETVMRIAHAAHENVGYVVGERALSTYDEAMLLLALRDLDDAVSRAIELLEARIGHEALPLPQRLPALRLD
jgi:transcriptional regulator with XRE-family HTH domain